MKRYTDENGFKWSQKRLGVDVARFGSDRSVIFPRQGLCAFQPVTLRNLRTDQIADRVMKAKQDWGSEMEFIDDTGHWGHGVIDKMIAYGHSPEGIQFHGKAIDPRFKNRRAEMWIKMSEWVKKGGCLPNIPELIGELTAPTYWFQNGVMVLEPKDQIKERLGRSPDLADALALTFAVPDLPAKIDQRLNKMHGKMKSSWDPMDDRM